MVILDAREREGRFSLEREPGPDLVELATERFGRRLHRVEEDAVRPEQAHDLRDRLRVIDRLAARTGVPRVVVDEHADAAFVERRDERG